VILRVLSAIGVFVSIRVIFMFIPSFVFYYIHGNIEVEKESIEEDPEPIVLILFFLISIF